MKNFRSKHSISWNSCLMVVFVLASLTACKKDSDPAPNNGVEGNWQVTAIKSVPAYNGISDFVAGYTLVGNTCPAQTTFNFKSNNSLEITAPEACKATTDQMNTLIGVNSTTTWKAENDKLILTTGSIVKPVALTVDATSMSLAQSGLDLGDNVDHTVTFVFKRL